MWDERIDGFDIMIGKLVKLQVLLLLIIVAGCRYRIFINGKFDHKDRELRPKVSKSYDSVFIFNASDSLPANIVVVNNTIIWTPYFWAEDFFCGPNYYTVLHHIVWEAKRVGANVIKFRNTNLVMTETVTTSNRFIVQMYSLKEPYLSGYNRKLDSINRAYKDSIKSVCIIHIKSMNIYTGNKCRIYINDSLLCYASTKDWRTPGWPEVNFMLRNGGVLSLHNKTKDTLLVKGNEYYFLIGSRRKGKFGSRRKGKSGGDNVFYTVRKDEYKNEELDGRWHHK